MGAAYVFTKTATGWHRAAKLEGPDTALDDFGGSVAISGSTMVASGADRAFVFTKTAAGWHQSAALEGPGSIADGGSGTVSIGPVGISGTTIVASAIGDTPVAEQVAEQAYVFVFSKTATGWHQAATLKEPGTVAKGDVGFSIAASGSTVVAGAPGEASEAGRAYVFGPLIGLVRYDPPTKTSLPPFPAGCAHPDQGSMLECVGNAITGISGPSVHG